MKKIDEIFNKFKLLFSSLIFLLIFIPLLWIFSLNAYYSKHKNIQLVLLLILLIIILLIFFICKKFLRAKQLLIKKILDDTIKENEIIKTKFISTISHELRTPLNIILNTTKLLNYKINAENLNSEYIKEKLSYIDRNSYRLLRLVNNIIDLNRIDSKTLIPSLKIYNIIEIIEDIISLTMKFAEYKLIDMIFDTSDEEILLSIDKALISRIILNLLSNSIKFSNKGGTIFVNIKKLTSSVIIEITDTGKGIPKDKISQIFDKFYQVDALLTRENEGCGLGLFVVKEFVKLQNGSIDISSIEGLGSTFTISLPITLKENMVYNYVLDHEDLSQLVELEMSDLKTY